MVMILDNKMQQVGATLVFGSPEKRPAKTPRQNAGNRVVAGILLRGFLKRNQVNPALIEQCPGPLNVFGPPLGKSDLGFRADYLLDAGLHDGLRTGHTRVVRYQHCATLQRGADASGVGDGVLLRVCRPPKLLVPTGVPIIPVSVTATRSTVPPLCPNLVARPEYKASDLRARVGAEGCHRLGHTIEAVNLCRYRRALADPSVPVVPPNDAIRSRLINFSFFKIGIVIFGEFHFLFPFDNAAGLVAKVKYVVCYGKA